MNTTIKRSEIPSQTNMRPRLGQLAPWAALRLWPGIVYNEMVKGLIIRWSYRFNMITEMVMFAFLFTGISFFMGRGSLVTEELASALIGYVLWFYAVIAISNMAWGLREEANAGTLEQMYMSPAPAALVQIGRTLATFVINTLIIGVMSLLLMLVLGFDLPLRWAGLPPFFLTIMGLYGFGYIIGGATLIFKQVEALANLVQNIILFLNGTFVSVTLMPGWLEAISRLLPTTEGIIVLRRVLLEGDSLAATWADGTLVALTIHSVLCFAIGLVIFSICEQIAKRRGLLGQY